MLTGLSGLGLSSLGSATRSLGAPLVAASTSCTLPLHTELPLGSEGGKTPGRIWTLGESAVAVRCAHILKCLPLSWKWESIVHSR